MAQVFNLCTRHSLQSCATRLRNAFTFVEMLIVLLIVAVGFLLATGVGSSVQADARARQTRHTQAVVLAALEAYHSARHAYPPGDGGPDSTVALLRTLRSTPACRADLQRLARGAIYQDENGNEFLVDGFAGPLLYDPAGGLGGKRPRLLSQGRDANDATDDIAGE
ncbi:MAG: type II secretion system protein [Phycisphaerae bacterium]|nr:type II secretion system protein [Phycisphaerae bacterium]